MASYEISNEGAASPWGTTARSDHEGWMQAMAAGRAEAQMSGRAQTVRYADRHGRRIVAVTVAGTGDLIFPRLSSPVISNAVPASDMFAELTDAERGLLAGKIHNASVGADPAVRAELNAITDDILAPEREAQADVEAGA